MLFQLCSMSGQVNTQPKSAYYSVLLRISNNSDWEDSGSDVAGIFDTSDPSHVVHHSMRRISAHLHRINEALESLDSELVKYRACIKNKLLGKLNTSHDPDTRLWWHCEIQNEMKVFHFYASFCIKLLCKDFCLEHYPVCAEEEEV